VVCGEGGKLVLALTHVLSSSTLILTFLPGRVRNLYLILAYIKDSLGNILCWLDVLAFAIFVFSTLPRFCLRQEGYGVMALKQQREQHLRAD
jgi:hypothetical protein